MANFNLNRAVLGGRLTADPDLRFTNSDRAVCSFTVAVNRPYKDGDGNSQSDFIRCVAWGNTAEFVAKYFGKGSSICVIGEITTRSYENDDEETVYVTEVTVRDVQFVDSKSESEGAEKKSEKSERSEKKGSSAKGKGGARR